MYILAIDTSTDMLCCSLGSYEHKAGQAHVSVLASQDHLCRRMSNVELTSAVLRVVKDAGISLNQIDCVVAGRGPGSFTGVRIGIATAKGLVCGLNCPVWGVSTLDAAAWTAQRAGVRGRLALVGDAMRGEVYPGIYELDDTHIERLFSHETVMKVSECIDSWRARNDASELILAGDGLNKYKDRFAEAGFGRFAPEHANMPSGEGLLRAAVSLWESDAYEGSLQGDPAALLPIYTRLSDAEENERERLGMGRPAFVEPSGVAEQLAGIHLQLRPMSAHDIAEVSRLEASVYRDASHKAWTESMFFEQLHQPQSLWWVAHDQGQIVGFVGAQLAGDVVDILDVVVVPSRRREKIAARLLERVCYDGQTLGASQSTLEVSEKNHPARALYENLGYSEQGVRRDYYGKGQHALTLSAQLPLKNTPDSPKQKRELRSWPAVYPEKSPQKVQLIASAAPLILAIESSCDETAMAIIDGHGKILSNVVATQIDFHARFGGVVPEIASRKHTEAVVGVFEETLARAGAALGCGVLTPQDLSAVAVTAGPGLVGALVVGVAFAKGLCAATSLPLIAVNHLEGHLLANLFATPDLEPPFIASLVSGGNTMLVYVAAWGDYEILGSTIDDAVGEAFDKVAKALGLGYPGGPAISRLAEKGNPRAIHFPRAMMQSGDYRFSLSGLKTAVINYIEAQNKAGKTINLPDLAASFEAAVVDVQVAKALRATEQYAVRDFCVGGGVAANPSLRAAYQEVFDKRAVRMTASPLAVCGDNAAMIALAALRNYQSQVFADLTLDANPHAPLDSWTSSAAPIIAEHQDLLNS